jgi:hypothetical protein
MMQERGARLGERLDDQRKAVGEVVAGRIQWQRQILVRWEYHAQNFLGFVELACLVILFRRF